MKRIKLLIGTLFGIGFLPGAPGTWGSLTILLFAYTAYIFGGGWVLSALLVITTFLSLVTADAVSEIYGEDPSQFVMDECAGQILAMMALPLSGNLNTDLQYLTAVFLLFRFFDIVKPLGINRLQLLEGKIGILADDLLAGLYALICIKLSELIIFYLI
ncbi:MAG: phosphatidylglycerophosphatase A [Bacteroidetes bacterium]|jgi:phosphatidylglycerophosphatase A|nr:phosphatidylglycerophosphatase A [Bacteroidota bacterium]